MNLIVFSLFGIIHCTPTPPTYDPAEHDPFNDQREEPISDSKWKEWNKDPSKLCPWWEAHKPGGPMNFPGN